MVHCFASLDLKIRKRGFDSRLGYYEYLLLSGCDIDVALEVKRESLRVFCVDGRVVKAGVGSSPTQRILRFTDLWKICKRGDTGIEPVTSCTQSKNHTPRPIALICDFFAS